MATDKKPFRVVLVYEYSLFREGLRRILEAHSQFRIVGEAGDGERAVQVVAATAPDAVLLDVQVCGDAVWTVRRIHEVAPNCRVIVLTAHERAHVLSSLLEVGVRGYLLKSVACRELVIAINSILGDPDRVILSVKPASVSAGGTGRAVLSRRQLEILKLVATAMSNRQIARRLSLTEPTVKRHLSNVFGRLGAVSRVDAINKARQLGLITGPRENRSVYDFRYPSDT